jgi:hypothetical protein
MKDFFLLGLGKGCRQGPNDFKEGGGLFYTNCGKHYIFGKDCFISV